MCAPAYAGATVAEAKPKASMEKYLASLVQREEEGWSVLADEVKQAPDEHFFPPAQANWNRRPSSPPSARRKLETTLLLLSMSTAFVKTYRLAERTSVRNGAFPTRR